MTQIPKVGQRLLSTPGSIHSTCLEVFVTVTPKEEFAGGGPANSSLGMTPTKNCILQPSQIISVCSRRHAQRRIGGALPANPSFGMTTTKILRHFFSRHGSCICLHVLFQLEVLLDFPIPHLKSTSRSHYYDHGPTDLIPGVKSILIANGFATPNTYFPRRCTPYNYGDPCIKLPLML